jgi:hypothetical protein
MRLPRSGPRFATALYLVFLSFQHGCAPSVATRTPEPQAVAAPAVWTAGIVEKSRPDLAPVLLRAVRSAEQQGFDRVVFEFAEAVPGYHIEYVDHPVRQCGSGEVMDISGDGWLEVRLLPAQAHTEAGEPTVTERERLLGFPILREMESACDFEADVTWVLGVASPNPYRVMELADPPRLVVDLRH